MDIKDILIAARSAVDEVGIEESLRDYLTLR